LIQLLILIEKRSYILVLLTFFQFHTDLFSQDILTFQYANPDFIMKNETIPWIHLIEKDTLIGIKYENYLYNVQSPNLREYEKDLGRIKFLVDSTFIVHRRDMNEDEIDEMAKLIKKHYNDKKNDHTFLYYFARALEKSGDIEQARYWYLKAAKIAPLFTNISIYKNNKPIIGEQILPGQIYENLVWMEIRKFDEISIDTLLLFMEKYYQHSFWGSNFVYHEYWEEFIDHPLKYRVDSLVNAHYPDKFNFGNYFDQKTQITKKEALKIAEQQYSRGNIATALMIYKDYSYFKTLDFDMELWLKAVKIAKELNYISFINSNYLSHSIYNKEVKGPYWSGWPNFFTEYQNNYKILGDYYGLATVLIDSESAERYNYDTQELRPPTDFSIEKIDYFVKNLYKGSSILMMFQDTIKALRPLKDAYELQKSRMSTEEKISILNYLIDLTERHDPAFGASFFYRDLIDAYFNSLNIEMAEKTQKRFNSLCKLYCDEEFRVANMTVLKKDLRNYQYNNKSHFAIIRMSEEELLSMKKPINSDNAWLKFALSGVIYYSRSHETGINYKGIKDNKYWYDLHQKSKQWIIDNESKEEQMRIFAVVEDYLSEVQIDEHLVNSEYDKALNINKQYLDGRFTNRDKAKQYYKHGDIYFEMGDYDESLKYYQLSMDEYLSSGLYLFPDLSRIWNSTRSIYYINKNQQSSLDVNNEAINYIESNINSLIKGQNIEIMDYLIDWYDNGVIESLQLKDNELALDYLELSKNKQFKYKLGLNVANRQKGIENINTNNFDDIIIGFDLISEGKEAIKRASNINFPISWTKDSTTFYTKVDTNDLLLRVDLLLTYVLSIEKNKIKVDYISVRDVDGEFSDEKGIKNALKLYYLNLSTNSQNSNRLSRKMYDVLITPIQDLLKNKKNITIIPDANFTYLPFETLINEEGEHLVENYNIKYIQSIEALAKLSKVKNSGFSNDIIAFGGADYNRNKSQKISLFRSGVNELENKLGKVLYRDELPNLPGSKDEVNSIVKYFDKHSIYTGSLASEPILKKLSVERSLKSYKYIHFAVHGRSYRNESKNTAIVLSLTDEALDEEDGYLTSDEIQQLDLDGNYVTLSACETAIGKKYISEGVLGLNYSFITAGAIGVTSTLWKIPDNSSNIFMKLLYKNLSMKKSYSDALSIVKRDFLSGKYGKEYSNPSIWAPFIYYGL